MNSMLIVQVTFDGAIELSEKQPNFADNPNSN